MSSECESSEGTLLIADRLKPEETMGDVLTKEQQQHKDDDEEEDDDEIDRLQLLEEIDQEPPPPSPHPPPVDVLAGMRPPSATPVALPPEPFQLLEEQDYDEEEDRLLEEASRDADIILKDNEVIESLVNKDQCQTNNASSDDDLCDCETCKLKKYCNSTYLRDLSKEDLHEIMKLRQLGMDLKQYIYYTFNWFIETTGFSENSFPLLPQQPQDLDSIKSFVELRESVNLLWDRIPDYLFMWLVEQAQEFMVFIKGQLMATYNHGIDNLAEVFLTKLLDGYDTLLATAVHISDLLEPLQKVLSKVNLSWEYINKSLYQYYIYNDPLIQNGLPSFIGQLRKHLSLKGSEYHDLVHRYLAFDDEITKIRNLYPEIKRIIDRYNAGDWSDIVIQQVREDVEKLKHMFIFSQPMLNTVLNDKKVNNEMDNSISIEKNNEDTSQESYFQACAVPDAVELKSMFISLRKSPQQKLSDLVEALTLPCIVEEEKKPIALIEQITRSSSPMEKTVEDDINKTVSCEQTCDCPSDDTSIAATPYIEQGNIETLQNSDVNNDTNSLETNIEPVVPASNEQQNPMKQHIENYKEIFKKFSKMQTAQTVQTQTKHSTTQTPNVPHTQNSHRHHHQGRCSSHSHLHGSLSNAVIKSSGPHRTHVGHKNHPSAAVACHKQQHIVEHIKRLSINDLSPGENGDCSDSGSSHGDSCSANNSPTPRDSNRHCDCCYCEVFGHGVPSVAPVSRNYNEMRERLRLLLSKKKAKICLTSCNPHAKNSVEVSSSSSSLSSFSSSSSTITNTDATTNHPNVVTRSNTPNVKKTNVPPAVVAKTLNTAPNVVTSPVILKPKEDHWNIEAAVEFIEGNTNIKKDSKKAEKKARQKQKKLEEKLKKEKEEEEKQKLIELQKKNPEVTITVVNPQKQSNQRTVPQPKLPEVSILPTKIIPVPKQQGTVKSKNVEVVANNAKNVNKNKSAQAVKVENTKSKTATISKVSDVISSNNTKSKTAGKVNEIPVQAPVSDNSVNLDNLTKKERKKLRQKMEKQAALQRELESKNAAENQSQIVTIKRIMESNSAEPTVTITLKGQTPAEDRVLFTLINGQTKDSNGDKQSQGTGKKKKNKGNNSANQMPQEQTNTKSQQPANNVKKNDSKNSKTLQQQQQSNKDKNKNKQQEEVKSKQQQQQNSNNAPETKSTKSKKDKKKEKDSENKENILKQPANVNIQKQETNVTNKKPNQTQNINQKSQQQQQQNPNLNNKNAKGNKNQTQIPNQTQNTQNTNKSQNQNQNQKQNNNNQTNPGKAGKGNTNTNKSNKNVSQSNNSNEKTGKVTQNVSTKQKQNTDNQRVDSPMSNNYKEIHNLPTINIENLKLPPGITITKVDAPAKPLPLKTNNAPKPINNTPKQTTIIAAPMSGVQSNYGNPQGTGNVIVVDTGRLKQDLMPKNNDKEASKDSTNQTSSSKKKKKKKNKNSNGTNVNEKVSVVSNNKQQSNQSEFADTTARIVHNPATNMVTIRNPAFGPPPPRIEPPSQQAAIIKVADNGMVTIRSPALQQAINAGLHPPPKPDFFLKGTITPHEPVKPSHNNLMSGSELSSTVRGSNGMPLSTDLAELRRRLAGQPENDRAMPSSTLFNNGLSSIQISKVTNGQSANIPENGINLKGTSVTLTKIRNPETAAYTIQNSDDLKNNIANGNANSKTRKKKKRGNGVRQTGDDWNLVESVFTPKDIDLEDGEMDDAERELEAFKRFCLQSVPPPRKEKVNLNLKDIVLKKKSSSVVAAI